MEDLDDAQEAFNELLGMQNFSYQLVLRLCSFVRNTPRIVEITAEMEALTLMKFERFNGETKNFIRNQIKHPFFGHLLVYLYEVLYPAHSGSLAPGEFGICMTVFSLLRRSAKLFPSFDQYADVLKSFGEDARQKLIDNGADPDRPFLAIAPTDDLEAINPFYLESLFPPCSRCPFCDNNMAKKRITAVVILKQTGIYPAMHWNFVCRNGQCSKAGCSRAYDSFSYKQQIQVGNDEATCLYRQLDRKANPRFVLQETRARPKYIQIDPRVFIAPELIRQFSILTTTGTSLSSFAKSYKGSIQHRISNPNSKIKELYESIVDVTSTRLTQLFHRAFFSFYIETLWLKERYGQPNYFQNIPVEEVNARCPMILDVNFNDEEKFLYPLLRFQRSFKGRYVSHKTVNQYSGAENPLRVLWVAPLDNALELLLDNFNDSRDEEGLHSCKRCLLENAHTGQSFTAACGDGVSINRHCCAFGSNEYEACHRYPLKSNHKTCQIHQEYEKFCEVSICANIKEATKPTCANQLCRDIYAHWIRQRTAARHLIRQRVPAEGSRERRRYRANFRNDTLPGFLQDALVELAEGAINLNNTEDFVNLLYTRADNALASEIGVRHGFGRRFTAMEYTISRPCGHYVHRQVCYRAEGYFSVLKALLIATAGGQKNVPCFFSYDSSCGFLYYMVNLVYKHLLDDSFELSLSNRKTFRIQDVLNLVKRISFVVDPFHLSSGHKHEGQEHVKRFCELKCNPERACTPKHRHLFENGEDGTRLVDLEAQEHMAKFVGKFQVSVRSFRALRADAYMKIVQSIHREEIFQLLLKQEQDPKYLGNALEHPYYENMD